MRVVPDNVYVIYEHSQHFSTYMDGTRNIMGLVPGSNVAGYVGDYLGSESGYTF